MVYGDYECLKIDKEDIDKLVFLPQVRKRKNSRIDEIAESIQSRRKLINQPDIARMTYDGLKSHIDFINQLWKKNVDINSFTTINGYYYVVIAGHTRLEALKRIPKSDDPKDEVVLKIHDVKSSEEILAIQLDENIHREISVEERAIAIIETYRLGIINGKWSDKADFIRQNKNEFSKHILNDILTFADLPIEIQEYIFSNNLPFSVGVELGRIYPLIVKYENEFEKSAESIEKNIKLHYATLLTRLQQSQSIKRALSIISAHAKLLNDYFKPKEEVQQEMFDWWEDAVNRQSELHFQQLMNDYNKAHQALNAMPFEYFMEILSLDTNLTGNDHTLDIQSVRKLYHQYLNDRFFNEQLELKKRHN
jgi:hypothetical protein